MTGFHDDDLRGALRDLDPAGPPDESAMDRVWDQLELTAPPTRRRWWELALAACAGAALVVGVAVAGPRLTTSTSDSAGVSSDAGSSDAGSMSMADGPAADTVEVAPGRKAQTLARDASAVVATGDIRAARDSFVGTVTDLGGRVTSETVTTDGSPDNGVATDINPPLPATPGVTVAVEVPSDQYEPVMAALDGLGDVVSFTQSSVDNGAEIADVQARITALRSSVATLSGLLDEATSISDVVDVENAIAQRQSDLDGLVAQQRYLRSQVQQARISVKLMTPADAAALYGGQPSGWQQVLDTLTTAWLWAGRVVLLTSPVWVPGLSWWLVRRRRR